MMKIAPSILSADFLHLSEDIAILNENADLIHLDIMDGSFVPNISFGFSVVDALNGTVSKPMDAHLMVVHPERWFERFAADGVSMLSFHYETAGRHCGEYIEAIRGLGMKAGIAINPDVPVSKLFPYVGKADFFVIMSVFAGFGGQKFIYESLDRIAALRERIDTVGGESLIEVDGGIDTSNASAVKEAGADILVAGSAVFKSKDPAATIRQLQLT